MTAAQASARTRPRASATPATSGGSAIERAPELREKDFLRQVRDLAEIFGWRVYHPWLSIHSPRGFPDLALCRPPRLILAELKTRLGKVAPAQEEWLALLRECPGVESFLWRPADWDAIERILR